MEVERKKRKKKINIGQEQKKVTETRRKSGVCKRVNKKGEKKKKNYVFKYNSLHGRVCTHILLFIYILPYF